LPEKLDRCVSKVKAKGGVENAWAVCKASMGSDSNNNSKKQEKVNKNRHDPYPSPDIKKGKVEPVIDKTPKNIGGGPIGKMSDKKKHQEAILYKQIIDAKLRNVPTR